LKKLAVQKKQWFQVRERLFSTLGLIFTAKRCILSDLNFEILGFLKA
jgi:hypothetical protein